LKVWEIALMLPLSELLQLCQTAVKRVAAAGISFKGMRFVWLQKKTAASQSNLNLRSCGNFL
jgi:hypothetical protein